MRAFPRQVVPEPGYSFACQFCEFDKFPFFWHFHPECELVLVLEGRGRRFVGDNIDNFNDGDLVLLGSNLPHAWHSEPQGSNDHYRRRSIVIQFHEDFLGPDFFSRPELLEIRKLLRSAERGLLFRGETQARAASLMTEMRNAQGFGRLAKLLSLLSVLAEGSSEVTTLSSTGFLPPSRTEGQQRMADVSHYINERYTKPLSLQKAAAVAHMSTSAFSRFFRRTSGKCFTDYVNELRVGTACRMLIETDETVAQVAFAVGFNNLSHFNRQFLRIKRMSPRDFRRAFLQSEAFQPVDARS
jgi:AraC-like DNA-binding protein